MLAHASRSRALAYALVPSCAQTLRTASSCSAPALQGSCDYLGSASAAGDWDSFVRHNWVPILSLALGPQWQSKYESEVAAIVALQLSVQPQQAQQEAPAAAVGPPAQQQQQHAAAAAAAGPPATSCTVAGRAPAATRPGVAPGRGRASAAGKAQPPPEAAPLPPPQPPTPAMHHPSYMPSPRSLDCIDVDGKRRRLRRKRAASPEAFGRGGGGGERGLRQQQQQHGGAPAAAPQASGQQGSAAVHKDFQELKVGGLQGVISKVSQLSLGSRPGTVTGTAPGSEVPLAGGSQQALAEVRPSAAQEGQDAEGPPGSSALHQGEQSKAHWQQQKEESELPCSDDPPQGQQREAQQQGQQEGQQQEDKREGGSSQGGGPSSAPLGAAARPAQCAAADGSDAAAVGEPVGTAAAGQPGGGGTQLLGGDLLESLGLLQDLSQRVVTDLRQVAEARGLSLPQQVSLHACSLVRGSKGPGGGWAQAGGSSGRPTACQLPGAVAWQHSTEPATTPCLGLLGQCSTACGFATVLCI